MEKSIEELLAQLKRDAEWNRANPENPICPKCNHRERPEFLFNGLCAECADDELQKKTGCRFGNSNFCTIDNHPDCYLPLMNESE